MGRLVASVGAMTVGQPDEPLQIADAAPAGWDDATLLAEWQAATAAI